MIGTWFKLWVLEMNSGTEKDKNESTSTENSVFYDLKKNNRTSSFLGETLNTNQYKMMRLQSGNNILLLYDGQNTNHLLFPLKLYIFLIEVIQNVTSTSKVIKWIRVFWLWRIPENSCSILSTTRLLESIFKTFEVDVTCTF